eukprot:scaffold3296_cov159-Ochromonas_danica.AAC.8
MRRQRSQGKSGAINCDGKGMETSEERPRRRLGAIFSLSFHLGQSGGASPRRRGRTPRTQSKRKSRLCRKSTLLGEM